MIIAVCCHQAVVPPHPSSSLCPTPTLYRGSWDMSAISNVVPAGGFLAMARSKPAWASVRCHADSCCTSPRRFTWLLFTANVLSCALSSGCQRLCLHDGEWLSVCLCVRATLVSQPVIRAPVFLLLFLSDPEMPRILTGLALPVSAAAAKALTDGRPV